jgi:all-trans-retinol 13,14-reductase
LGGLCCGVILAKNGYEVTVLEQHWHAGGCLQCFRRGDFLFETGMHYIGSADPGQTLHTILRYLDVIPGITLERLNPMGYDVVALQGRHYQFANGKQNFVNTLAEHFPESRSELERYYDLAKHVASSWAIHSLSQKGDLKTYVEYQTKSVGEVIDSLISNPLLRQVLAGTQFLYAGEKYHTPFSTHALITDSYDQSAFRIVGGSSLMADRLTESIRSRGGKVLTGRKAVRIECDGTKATAVITADGERFPADLIISDIHPANTMQLIDSRLIKPAYRQRMAHIRNTTSVFTVYLKFRKNSVRYMDHNLYYYRGDSVWDCQHYDDASWPKCLLYMHAPTPQTLNFHGYAETGEIMTYMSFDEVRQWADTHVGCRGEDYEVFKRKKAEAVIDALEQEVPGLRDNIEHYYTSTPLTYVDYTGTPDGAMYGMLKDVKDLRSMSISSKTRIPNLLLTGQNITLHGMMGVMAGSLLTCSEVLTVDRILGELKN